MYLDDVAVDASEIEDVVACELRRNAVCHHHSAATALDHTGILVPVCCGEVRHTCGDEAEEQRNKCEYMFNVNLIGVNEG